MNIKTTAATLWAAALLAGLLSACGTTTTDSSEAGRAESTAAGASEGCADAPERSTDPVEITDDFGRTVKLQKPAERVAVLEWQQTEDLLSLCVEPVAVADTEGFALWDTAEQLPDGVQDVGTRGEANLDAVFGTDPDLVIVEASAADDDVLEQLAKYDVPVLATKGADAADPVAKMLGTFDLIARATGTTERAKTVTDEFEATVADAKEAVAEADPATTDFVYFDGYIDGGNVTLRPFGTGSLIGALGEDVGLTNAWTGETDPAYGLGQTDIEGMTAAGEASLFYTGTVDPAGDILPELKKNKIFQSLPAVQDGRAKAFPPGIWTFGGPRSSEQIVRAYVDLVTG